MISILHRRDITSLGKLIMFLKQAHSGSTAGKCYKDQSLFFTFIEKHSQIFHANLHLVYDTVIVSIWLPIYILWKLKLKLYALTKWLQRAKSILNQWWLQPKLWCWVFGNFHATQRWNYRYLNGTNDKMFLKRRQYWMADMNSN